jgi:hypothetical protein
MIGPIPQGEDRANMVQLRRRVFSTFLRRAWLEHTRELEAKARLLRPKVVRPGNGNEL